MKAQEAEQVVTVRFRNKRATSTAFCLEPWGDVYDMPPGAEFEAVARGPQGGALTVDLTDDHLVLWNWEGSVVVVYDHGAPLGPTEETRWRV